MTTSAQRQPRGSGGRFTTDVYPSRVFEQPRWLPRLDPVVYADGDAEGPLTRGQLEQFERDGFLFLEGYFGPGEVEAFEQELRDLSRNQEIRSRPETIREPDSGEVRSIFRVHELSDVFDWLARTPRLADLARQLLDSEVYVHQSRINYKPGFAGREFFWHSDFETWHTEDGLPRMRTVSASINLTPNHEHNGPLMLIPGSQRHFISCVGETPEDNYKMSLRKQVVGTPDGDSLRHLASEHGIVSATGVPGSLLLFDCNVLHGSNGNISPDPRSNIFFVFNSVHNLPEKPFCGLPPRPEFIASRSYTPIEVARSH